MGLAGIFGNPEESDDEDLKNVSVAANGWTTRIWNGNSVETYRYNGGNQLPSMEGHQTVGTPIPPRSSESDDYEDKDQSTDRDRGLEEDQYPGE